MEKNMIGLDKAQTLELSNQLNALLADYQVLYMNVRGYHWNIKGRDFYELHAKFEEIYTAFITQIDDIAERILTIGGTPIHGYSAYLTLSEIPEQIDVTEGKVALEQILTAYQHLLIKQRNILAMASDVGDEGTVSLLSDYISQQEKETWMMNAYLQ